MIGVDFFKQKFSAQVLEQKKKFCNPRKYSGSHPSRRVIMCVHSPREIKCSSFANTTEKCSGSEKIYLPPDHLMVAPFVVLCAWVNLLELSKMYKSMTIYISR